MANRSTRRQRKAVAKTFAANRKAGTPIVPPPSKRRTKWRGARVIRQAPLTPAPW